MQKSQFITLVQAQEVFSIKETTLWKLRKDGLIKTYKLGKKKFVKLNEIEKLIEEGLPND